MSENTRHQPDPMDPMANECPRCGAEPNQPCTTRGGREAKFPHVQRRLVVDEWLQDRAVRRLSRTRALCCQCGNLRTVSHGYSAPRDENRTCDDNSHALGWRCTVTLKCSNCCAATRHAVLRDADSDRPEYRDIAETRMHLRPGEGLPFCTFGGDGLRRLAAIPHPAGAEYVDDWCDLEYDDPHRYFRGSSWIVERDSDKDIRVTIDGIQRPDGDVKRLVFVAEGDTEAITELSSDQARQLGAALIAAADEADQR